MLLVKPDVMAKAAAAVARGDSSCPEREIEVLVLEAGLIVLGSVEFRLKPADVETLFADSREKVGE